MIYTLADLKSWRDLKSPIRLGVIGDPVAHSLSPQMMNAALTATGLPHRYGCFHIRPNEFRDALRQMRELDFVGANITIPHKIAAREAMDYVEEDAVAVGAVNTVQFRHGKMRGFNTDGIGFAKAVREEFGADVRELRVLILGAGGAARAIASVCANARMWSRREHSLEEMHAMTCDVDLIVNATPVGLLPNESPLLTRANFRRDQLVFDTIYATRTRLIDEAAAAGARAADGLSMLLHQGAAAFEIWFNQPAPLDAMRAALG